MKTSFLILTFLLAGTAAFAREDSSLAQASDEAKAMAKLIKENPCYHDIELSVRDLKIGLHASPDQARVLEYTRECRVEGAPSAPRAVRLYATAGVLTGVRLITALGSDETTVVLLARNDEGGWTVLGELGKVKTAALLSSAGVRFPSGLDLETVPYAHPG